MTFAPSRPCKHPGCSALVGAGAGTYCPAHRTVARAEVAVRDRHRGTAAERGYDAGWQRYRFGFLAQWPLCMGVLVPVFRRDWLPAGGQAGAENSGHAPGGQQAETVNPGNWPAYRAAAEQFHALREKQREAGRIASYSPEAMAWLLENPIYRLELWDVTKPATVVDHIIPHKGDHELMWSPWNHQPVTARAHNRKTATEKPLHAS